LSLVGGAAADSHDRRRIVILSQLVPFACAAALWRLTATGAADLPRIFGLIAAVAVASAFESPARIALLPGLVPRPLFPRAVTLSTSASALAFVTGPALGGLVIAEAGVATTYALHSLLVAVSLGALAFLRPGQAPGERRAFSWQSIVEGVSFVRRRQVVLGAMTLDMFAVIFGGAQALLPVYAREILRVGPRGYGLLTASLELGALLMAVALIALPPIRSAGRALLWAVAAYGVATVLFGVSRSFPLSVLAYMAVGMADQVSVVTRHTLVQLATPDALRGRVSSVNMVFIGASNQLGAVEAGFVAALTSATFAVVSGGLACLAVLGVVALRMPELRRHRIDDAPPTPGG
jgi:MFS family permease